VLEDQAVREERDNADELLREERAERAHLLSIGRDDTDKDLLYERARSDDLIATRDEFLGTVSHDLRNMLHAMVGSTALIATEVSREDPAEKVLMHAQRIQRAAARMNRLIGDLVDVASIEGGTLAVAVEAGDPTHVVTEAVNAFQAQASKFNRSSHHRTERGCDDDTKKAVGTGRTSETTLARPTLGSAA
jgi:signal transduction histidine kinase